jgi:hypothetical protein
MFKIYCHMSSIPQCYTILYPLNPINLKKKRYHLVDPARAKNRSILLRSKSILPSSQPPVPTKPSFYLPFTQIGPRPIFKLIRSCLLLLGFASHLASALPFSFLATLNQLGWRLKQLAALRQLNKLRCDPLSALRPQEGR